MELRRHASVRIPRKIEEVFDVAVACDTFPRILPPLGPIPGIAAAALVDSTTLETGVRRRITMTDGSEIEEHLVLVERPTRHRYRWMNRPPAPFSWLVRGAEGDWTFGRDAGHTTVDWTYTFELTSPLAAPLAMPVLWFFRRWMDRGLARLRDELAR